MQCIPGGEFDLFAPSFFKKQKVKLLPSSVELYAYEGLSTFCAQEVICAILFIVSRRS